MLFILNKRITIVNFLLLEKLTHFCLYFIIFHGALTLTVFFPADDNT